MRSKPLKEPLSITHPQLAAQWHPTKNGNLTPDQVVAGSHKKAWWIYPNASDHKWEASIGNRARMRRLMLPSSPSHSWGRISLNYLREAYRTLKLDGQLHIIEATSRFSDLRQFQNDL